jgi:hypothetical protein
VQFGQRLALTGMLVMQKGHSFVDGSDGAACSFFLKLAALMIRKTTSAMIRKSKMDCRKAPHLMTAAPTVNACSAKLTPPSTSPIAGIRTSLTSEAMIGDCQVQDVAAHGKLFKFL